MKTISMTTIKNNTSFEELLNALNVNYDDCDYGMKIVLASYRRLLKYPEVAEISIKRINTYIKRDELKTLVEAQAKMYGEAMIERQKTKFMEPFILFNTPELRKKANEETLTEEESDKFYLDIISSHIMPCIWNDLTNDVRNVRKKFADDNATERFIERMGKCETSFQQCSSLALENIGIFEPVEFREVSDVYSLEQDDLIFSVNGEDYMFSFRTECNLGNYISEKEMEFLRKHGLPGANTNNSSNERFGTLYNCALYKLSPGKKARLATGLKRVSMIF